MMPRVPMCGRFADYGVYHTLLVLNDVAAAKAASSIGSGALIHRARPLASLSGGCMHAVQTGLAGRLQVRLRM